MHWFYPGLELQTPLSVSYMKFADSLAFLHSVLWYPSIVIYRPSECPSQITHKKLNHFMDHLVADVFRCLFTLRASMGEKTCTDI